MIDKLLELLASDSEVKDLYDYQKHDKRETILKILEYLVNYKNDLLSKI